MPKRFTDTEKWNDPWFRRLHPDTKLVWDFITCRCDAAGVWEPDREDAEFRIGKKIDWPLVMNQLLDKDTDPVLFDGESKPNKPRISLLPGGRWQILGFISFQYGNLSHDCKPHLKVYELIKKHDLLIEAREDNGGRDKPSSTDGPAAYSPDFLEFYSLYPSKEAKDAAFRKYRAVRKRGISQEKLLAGVKNYLQYIEEKKPEFIKYPATWLNGGCWNDEYNQADRRPAGGAILKEELKGLLKILKEGGKIKDSDYAKLPTITRRGMVASCEPDGTFWTLKTKKEKAKCET
jgi:hypothetical protein